MFGREANCCSRVYWIIVLVHLALLAILLITDTFAVAFDPKVALKGEPTTGVRFPVVHFHNFNQIRFHYASFPDFYEFTFTSYCPSL